MQKGRENKAHIGIYGRRNNGKSSLINLLAGQDIAIVSDIAGTTTDPVKKSFEITGMGPVVLIDTAGIDDLGDLGEKRIAKTLESVKTIDLAILVVAHNSFETHEKHLIEYFKQWKVPFFVIYNKTDEEALDDRCRQEISTYTSSLIEHSNLRSPNVDSIIDVIKKTLPESIWKTPSMFGDLLSYGDIVLLVVPIDIEAPAGRLILPQVQAIRDILDNDCIAIVVKERELDIFLRTTSIRPKLVVTDSSLFFKVAASVPQDVPLTGFSVLLARLKGDFEAYLEGTPAISQLQNGDRILLLESCTHHVSCDDIGRVKIPRWITNFTGKSIEFDVVSGLDTLTRPIEEYSLVIQCGGCMITRKQLLNRLNPALQKAIPITNYGMAIAYVQGIYNRAIAPFTGKKDEESEYL